MEFQNKIALVTGAASGIGKATAIALSSKGAYVIAADINVIGGEETIEEIRNAGNLGKFIKVNVAEYQEVKDLTKEIKRKFGRLDIAINNAGIAGANARTIDYPIDDWNKVMQINASSVFYCMKEQIPIMIEQGGGVIVNTASIAGLRGLPNSLAYVASKHAVKQQRWNMLATRFGLMQFVQCLLSRHYSILSQLIKSLRVFQTN